ncbi:phosphopantetheine-binding protein [Streptomyces carpaticus]|uniref:fumarylacetoacetate hydrolase family protein n=1 Tax=Streptomyces carpaticus TaxID=285558 RepID=UPI0021FFCD65|nr:phosphopantetheine-binding protein [Streptomyces carpaticus]
MYEVLKSILVEEIQVPESDVRPDIDLREAGLDSLAMVELSMALNKRLDIDITDDELTGATTVADIVRLMEERDRRPDLGHARAKSKVIMSGNDHRSMARALYTARATRVPIAPLTDENPWMDMADGYAVQRELTGMLSGDGEEIIGYKAGLTSAPMQRQFGVDTPDYGPVLASTLHADGDLVPREAFIAPKVEAEIVFRLGRRLMGLGVTVEEARSAITEVMAGLEIVDSRIKDWRIRLPDTIADLASNAAVVLGEKSVPYASVDPRLIGMVFSRNGDMVATSAGAAALGDPVAVVAWLANTLGAQGVALEAGHVIMTGALHAAVTMEHGDTFHAEFDHLGSITIRT